MKYNHQEIEEKWQRFWEKEKTFEADSDTRKKKFYCLDMFPYPSGEGLHVGHPRGYTASDIFSHYQRRNGFNVLHPMGWDAFGLPAENYAIKTGIHPAISTEKNINNFRRQIKSLGLSYDWSREINTTDPDYYKFTQLIFLKLFEKGLAYEAILPINWCPSCKTGLANEEVIEGKCDRCKTEVTKKNIRQWVLKITAYADRLLDDLNGLDWPDKIKEMQKNWIGRSEGWEISFQIKDETVKVFTTRADTLFGATYLVFAPEHPLIQKLTGQIKNFKAVESYIQKTFAKSERERISEMSQKTGIELKGVKAINPLTGKEIPVFVADYVLLNYGTGAIMAVPAHDKRDFDFAKRHDLPIVEVIRPSTLKPKDNSRIQGSTVTSDDKIYEGEGVLVNSDKFDGLRSSAARSRIGSLLAKKGLAEKKVNYKLRDWVFSRQRYWGEPIPIVHCPKCGLVPLKEKDLPLTLPSVEKYQPTGTGESPLAELTDWVNTTCPICQEKAKRETNTMPQWAGSCWYYLAYTLGRWKDEEKSEFVWDKKKIDYFNPVDLYVGGAEHAVLHLLYARFWHKFLYDLQMVSSKEPFLKLKNVGLILGTDGQKMSKSRGNVVSPDSIVQEYGADTLRLYEMFIGPFSQEASWSLQGIKGCFKFLEAVWSLREKVEEGVRVSPSFKKSLNKAIKKISQDIEEFKFNLAVSELMILVNKMKAEKAVSLSSFKTFLLLLAPFAPHISEELWEHMKEKPSIHQKSWPVHDDNELKEEKEILIVQVNGRVRARLEAKSLSEKETISLCLKNEVVKKWIGGKEIKKTIFVPGKLVNFVV